MISFLKESTFKVNDVLQTAWKVLRHHYLSIAGLCFIMFVVSFFSATLAGLLADTYVLIRIVLFIAFLFLYFGLQLALFKYTFRVLDHEDEDVAIKMTIPTVKEIVYFFTGTLYFVVSILLVFMISAIVVFPLIYTGISIKTTQEIALILGGLLAFITWTRISFFPFFIIDKHHTPFRSLRFSLAITRGNFIRICLLLGFFALFNALSWYFSSMEYYILSLVISLVNSFLIGPLSAVTLVVAYRQMMSEYRGEEDPEIMHNLI